MSARATTAVPTSSALTPSKLRSFPDDDAVPIIAIEEPIRAVTPRTAWRRSRRFSEESQISRTRRRQAVESRKVSLDELSAMVKLDRTGSSKWVVRAQVWNGKGDASAKVNAEGKLPTEAVADGGVLRGEEFAQKDRQG